MITNERATELENVLCQGRSEEEIKKLLEMSPEEVHTCFTNEGYDFTIDEIKAYGAKIQEIAEKQGENGELSAEDLEDVSGGKGEFRAGLAVGLLIGLSLGGW